MRAICLHEHVYVHMYICFHIRGIDGYQFEYPHCFIGPPNRNFIQLHLQYPVVFFSPGIFPPLLATFTVPFIDMRPWWTNVTVASIPSRVLRLRDCFVGKKHRRIASLEKMTQKCREKTTLLLNDMVDPKAKKRKQPYVYIYIYTYICIKFAPNDSWFWMNCVRVHEKTLWITQPRVVVMSLLSNLLLPAKKSHLKDGGIWRGMFEACPSSLDWYTTGAASKLHGRVILQLSLCITYLTYLYIYIHIYSTSWVYRDTSNNENYALALLYLFAVLNIIIYEEVWQKKSGLQWRSSEFLSTKPTNGSPNFSHLQSDFLAS